MKTLKGTVISVKMTGTAVVTVERTVVHPLYKKRLKKHKKYKADIKGVSVKIGDVVTLAETKPLAKEKNFKVLEVAK